MTGEDEMRQDREFVEDYTRRVLARRAYNRIRSYIKAMDESHQKDVSLAWTAVLVLSIAAIVTVAYLALSAFL